MNFSEEKTSIVWISR